MKNILLVLLIGFALSLCNLSGRFKKDASTSGSSSTNSAGEGPVEHGQPTAEQTAALAGGREAKWERQGISWTVPPNWTEQENE